MVSRLQMCKKLSFMQFFSCSKFPRARAIMRLRSNTQHLAAQFLKFCLIF